MPFKLFQCRAHLYQARISPGADASGLCDAFVKVLIGEHCRITEVLLSPLHVCTFLTFACSRSKRQL